MDDVRTLALGVLLGSFEGPRLPSWCRDLVADGLGGICLYGSNVDDAEQAGSLNAAVHEARPDAITALDEEGGDVTRLWYLEGSPHAGHAVLGRVDDAGLTRAVAGDIGTRLLRHGVDLDLGPVADVNSAPTNPVIGARSFGAAPGLAARHVAAYVEGLQAAGAGACLKHFPGHGDTTLDSHLDLPSVDAPLEVLRERELVPFAAGIGAGAVAVMTSHVLVRALDGERPATFSRRATVLLRDELGFDGLLVSDALDMRGASGGRGVPAAAVLALRAGVDLLCLGSAFTEQMTLDVVDAVVAAVASGELPQQRLAEAAARVRVASSGLAALRAAAVPAPDDDASLRAALAAIDGLDAGLPLGADGPVQVLRLVNRSNEAVGHAPWGLPRTSALLAGRLPRDVTEADVQSGHDPLESLDPHVPVVVLARDAHRHAWVMALLGRLARRRPDAVVVDLGWPGPEPSLAGLRTIRTWGASAVSGRALDEALTAARSGRTTGACR